MIIKTYQKKDKNETNTLGVTMCALLGSRRRGGGNRLNFLLRVRKRMKKDKQSRN